MCVKIVVEERPAEIKMIVYFGSGKFPQQVLELSVLPAARGSTGPARGALALGWQSSGAGATVQGPAIG